MVSAGGVEILSDGLRRVIFRILIVICSEESDSKDLTNVMLQHDECDSGGVNTIDNDDRLSV